MDLHRHTLSPVTQLETLLKLQRQCLDELAAFKPEDDWLAFHGRMQHLRNATELVEAWALGADEALIGVMLELSSAGSSGSIPSGVLESILNPVAAALGEQYTCEAMAMHFAKT